MEVRAQEGAQVPEGEPLLLLRTDVEESELATLAAAEGADGPEEPTDLSTPRADKLAQLAAAAETSPRHIKWHHSSPLLPPAVVEEGKVIYVFRNPKDTVVSWYHFQRMNVLYGFTGSFDAFFELFLRGDVAYGCYWFNVLSWWRLRHRPNVLVLTYEAMHSDLLAVVRQVAM